MAGYQGVLENDRVVLAARTRVGSIFGASRSYVPASERFYAGGGGSVRGYKYQSIGPRDSSNDPLGGRSVMEVNTEARIKIIGPFGVVPFIDGGQVYDAVYPQLASGDLQWAGGLGLRYYSPSARSASMSPSRSIRDITTTFSSSTSPSGRRSDDGEQGCAER